jgi:hypothetical protein
MTDEEVHASLLDSMERSGIPATAQHQASLITIVNEFGCDRMSMAEEILRLRDVQAAAEQIGRSVIKSTMDRDGHWSAIKRQAIDVLADALAKFGGKHRGRIVQPDRHYDKEAVRADVAAARAAGHRVDPPSGMTVEQAIEDSFPIRIIETGEVAS